METLRGRRVLIVEDEYFIAQDLVQALEELGAVVIGPVGNPDDALAAIDPIRCDAAILDLNMMGQVDFRVADELQRRRLPFVFATGYDAGIIPPHHQSVERFEKPYDAVDIGKRLAGMLAEG
jgi:CheY-like chemotaxis protein